MRLRTLATAALISVAAITGSAGVSHVALTAGGSGSLGSSGSMDFGSSADDVAGPVSGFLWQNPGGRYIVVLGAKVGTLGQNPEILDQRLSKAAALGRTHPFNRIIASGGGTWWLPVSEAQFMNVGLIQRGIPVWQMVNEGTSRSTVENANNTVRMLKSMGADGAVIVTNGFHMRRAIKNFRDAARAQKARIAFMPAYA